MTREQPTIKARRIGIVELPPERWYRWNGTPEPVKSEPKTKPVPKPKPKPGPKPVREKSKPCTAEGCKNNRHARGYCKAHARKIKAGLPLDYDGRFGTGFDPAKCGTLPGYASHARYNVPVDDACLEAKTSYDRERYEQRKQVAA